MKFQTLFSLATVGLAFATPVHNLEARDDYTNCVINLVKEAVSDGCANLPVCQALPEFVQCMQNGIQQLASPFSAIAGFPKLLIGCTNNAQKALTEDEFRKLSEALSPLVEESVAQCSAQ
ncbi:hypothetical protein RU639_009282 [Aspergillus parasiticus]